MKTITLHEHDRLYAVEPGSSESQQPGISRAVFERLRDFDLDRADREAGPDGDANYHSIFDWSRRSYAKARQYVGVLSLGNVAIEVLPKIEKSGAAKATMVNQAGSGGDKDDATERVTENEDTQSRVQLLQMLRYAGVLKAKSRDIAMLASSRATMSEMLFWLFAQRIREELGRGMIREYEERREELGVIRGRIDVKQYAQASVRRPGKIPCVYERHSVNTPLLRLLRAACEFLAHTSTAVRTREILHEVLVSLDNVDRVSLSPMLADAVQMTRREERFEDIVVFCRMLAQGQRPDARSGDTPSFSLLFDMNRLFEGFLAGFFREEVLRLPRFHGVELHEQGHGFHKRLVKRVDGGEMMTLKPDLAFTDKTSTRLSGRPQNIIMDAKWKRPKGRHGRPSGDVLYQMYAYATQFNAPTVVVLYPRAIGTSPADFDFAKPDVTDARSANSDSPSARLMVRYVPLDLPLDKRAGRDELRTVLARVLEDALPSSSVGRDDSKPGAHGMHG